MDIPDIYLFFLDSSKKIVDSSGHEYLLSFHKESGIYAPVKASLNYDVDAFKTLIRTWTVKQSKTVQEKIEDAVTLNEITNILAILK